MMNLLKKLILSSLFILSTHAAQFSGEILVTGSVHGELVSCGCKNRPLGGFDQLYGLKNSRFPNAILIDGGNLTNGPTSILTPEKNKILKNVLTEMNYAAFVPGNFDLRLGFEKYLQALPDNATILLTNSNGIKDVHPYLLLQDKNELVVILGVLSPKLVPELKLNPVKKTITKVIEKLKKKYPSMSLSFLLISHQERNEDSELADINDLKWIINTHDELFFEKSRIIGNARWGGLKSENHYVAALNTRLSNSEMSYQLIPVDEGNAEKVSSNPMRSLVQPVKAK